MLVPVLLLLLMMVPSSFHSFVTPVVLAADDGDVQTSSRTVEHLIEQFGGTLNDDSANSSKYKFTCSGPATVRVVGAEPMRFPVSIFIPESSVAQQPPPVDAAEIFNNAVRAIFSRWTLLRLAVDQGWADGDEAQKADALVTRILEMVAPSVRRVPDESEIADVLHDSIEGTFNAQAEDGSVEEIARTILRLRAECSAGNVATATTYIQQAASDLSSSVGREDEAGEVEEVVAPAPAPLPIIDEDGLVIPPCPARPTNRPTAHRSCPRASLIFLRRSPCTGRPR